MGNAICSGADDEVPEYRGVIETYMKMEIILN